jgi:lipoprotein-anchoring transpeptidase ErfK/SrfK
LVDEAKRQEIALPEFLIVADTQTQQLHAFPAGKSDQTTKTYTISTSKFGLGSEEGSYKTPTGFHAIADRIGNGEPLGRVFASREPQEEVVPASEFHTEQDNDRILSRILRLDGLEPHNTNSYERYIYIHGTNQEHLLGTPASHGCIRMGNEDIIELFDLIGNQPVVCWVIPLQQV